MFVIGALLIFN